MHWEQCDHAWQRLFAPEESIGATDDEATGGAGVGAGAAGAVLRAIAEAVALSAARTRGGEIFETNFAGKNLYGLTDSSAFSARDAA